MSAMSSKEKGGCGDDGCSNASVFEANEYWSPGIIWPAPPNLANVTPNSQTLKVCGCNNNC